jgi:hypothetical protein
MLLFRRSLLLQQFMAMSCQFRSREPVVRRQLERMLNILHNLVDLGEYQMLQEMHKNMHLHSHDNPFSDRSDKQGIAQQLLQQ